MTWSHNWPAWVKSLSSRNGSSMGKRRKCRIHSSWVRLPTCSLTLFQSSLYISRPSSRSRVSWSVHSRDRVAAPLSYHTTMSMSFYLFTSITYHNINSFYFPTMTSQCLNLKLVCNCWYKLKPILTLSAFLAYISMRRLKSESSRPSLVSLSLSLSSKLTICFAAEGYKKIMEINSNCNKYFKEEELTYWFIKFQCIKYLRQTWLTFGGLTGWSPDGVSAMMWKWEVGGGPMAVALLSTSTW